MVRKMGDGDMVDKEQINDALRAFEKNWQTKHDMFEEYLQFSRFVQGCFISKEGYIIDTGNFQCVNYEMMYRIKEKIRRHPLLWKLFFVIA